MNTRKQYEIKMSGLTLIIDIMLGDTIDITPSKTTITIWYGGLSTMYTITEKQMKETINYRNRPCETKVMRGLISHGFVN